MSNGKDTVYTEENVQLHPQEVEEDQLEIKYDTKAGWLVVLGSFFAQFMIFGIELCFGVFYEHYHNKVFRSSSAFSLAFVGTLCSACITLTGMVSGSFADKYGYRFTMVAGGVVVALGLLLASFSTQVWQLYLTQGIMFGVGGSFVYSPSIAAPNTWFSKHRGIAMGVAAAGTGVGGLCLAPLTRFIIDHLGFQWALRVLSLLTITIVLLAATVTRPLTKTVKESFWDFQILKDWRFAAMLYVNLVEGVMFLIPFYLISNYAVSIKLSPQQGALLVGLVNAATSVGQIVLGKIADHAGCINILAFCATMMGLSCLFIWLFASTYGVLIVFALVYGAVSGGFISLYYVGIAELFGIDKIATYLGMLLAGAGIGNLVGSPIASALQESSNSYDNAIIFAGVLGVAGSWGVWYIRFRTVPKLFARY